MSALGNSTATATEENDCGAPERTGGIEIRIAAIFIILVTSILGTLFPILTRKSRRLNIHPDLYEAAKYFGSGVIIATAFIHLLAPANESLSSPCLSSAWQVYPWPEGIAMCSVFVLFIVEVIALRMGSSRLAALGVEHHSHGAAGGEARPFGNAPPNIAVGDPPVPGQGGAARPTKRSMDRKSGDGDSLSTPLDSDNSDIGVQLVGAAILELGVIFHSVVIGLTLAVDPKFTTFFIVIIFHQMFEGLGLGSRLSQLQLPERLRQLPLIAGLVYSFVTPIGLAIGLGIRNTYNPNSATALMVSGCLDSFSAGILLYTGLVELLARDFISNPAMLLGASDSKMAFSICAVLFGAGLMALLGRWA